MPNKRNAISILAFASRVLAVCFLAFLTVTPVQRPALAQSDPASEDAPDPAPEMSEAEARAARALEARLKARTDQEKALSTIEQSIAMSEQRRDELSQEIARLKADRQTIQTDLIDTANRIQTLESSISEREARLKILFADQTELRVSLAEQRDSLSKVLAALQRIGRNPPPALAVRPNEALDAVRSAILLSTLVPEIRLEATSLATQLEELIRLHTEIEDEKGALQGGLAKLEEEQQRLDLLMQRKEKQQSTTARAAEDEQKKTAELAAKAESLQDLIEGMEKEIEAARLAVREAKDAEKRALEQKIETKKQKIAALKDAARLSPAIPFDKMRGLLRLPANGTILKQFGTSDGFGGRIKGLSIATRAGAQVTSPADGWIVYAGPFRSFGKLLIINAGDGYHIVLSGLDELFAEVGSFVLANEPVGTMQKTRLAASDLLDAGTSKPVLYMELRKDGVAVDPAPWWTAVLKEKADG
ncbi:Septal ring factor EnvC, activator of murein hydrolases AmiA and AmiB [Cohaesibacter sp. ES.047]|uniref:murein hydrolase activator EnvC family protein n=1 Tax=Cohaesibacter sp. ES.047 TaxID=1798205 RepID=UPI000BB82E8C|nr:peptidoglycan DD-metalloendopeptidase family protein [Cohaesibacter sp. ES.047]SNY90681.1 Septal ring factor EnvC, activator of murein hydrolases AmiA and AmiB [Cohaesibacter sp. ES.047]